MHPVLPTVPSQILPLTANLKQMCELWRRKEGSTSLFRLLDGGNLLFLEDHQSFAAYTRAPRNDLGTTLGTRFF